MTRSLQMLGSLHKMSFLQVGLGSPGTSKPVPEVGMFSGCSRAPEPRRGEPSTFCLR